MAKLTEKQKRFVQEYLVDLNATAAAKRAGYDKAITFEFSHFMSPQSAYLQAGNLYNRYKEYFEIK